MTATENQVHRAVLAFLCRALPRDVCGPWHTPNGEARDAATGAKLKAMGVIPGVPDLMFLWWGCAYAIEIKRPNGRLTASQRVWRERFENNGGRYGVARSVDDAAALCAEWGIPVRVRA